MSTTRRLRRLAGIVAAALLATTTLLSVATTAQADIELSTHMVSWDDPPPFPLPVIEVHGSDIPAEAEGATHVAIALCDIDGATTPGSLGTRCDAANAIGFTPIADYLSDNDAETPELELTVEPVFNNWNFTANQAGVGQTECAGVGDEDCAVVVSFYSFVPFPNFLHAEAEEITFETP